jgi:hypothetical protein
MASRNYSSKQMKLIVLTGLVTIVSLTFSIGSFYFLADCFNKKCIIYQPEKDSAQVEDMSKSYAEAECKKSYDVTKCEKLIVESQSYNCGIMGFCGWIVNVISNPTSNFIYQAGLDLESQGIGKGYKVTSYDELDSINSRKTGDLMQKMCLQYEPSRQEGCFDRSSGYFSSSINWYGNFGSSSLGKAEESTKPESRFLYTIKISRDGKVQSGYIKAIDDSDEDNALYTLKAV